MSNFRTEILSLRVTRAEKERLQAGADGAGLTLCTYLYEVLMDSLAVPGDKTALLEAVLQQGFIQREIAKIQGVDERAIERVEARAASISAALRGRFAVSRGGVVGSTR